MMTGSRCKDDRIVLDFMIDIFGNVKQSKTREIKKKFCFVPIKGPILWIRLFCKNLNKLQLPQPLLMESAQMFQNSFFRDIQKYFTLLAKDLEELTARFSFFRE